MSDNVFEVAIRATFVEQIAVRYALDMSSEYHISYALKKHFKRLASTKDFLPTEKSRSGANCRTHFLNGKFPPRSKVLPVRRVNSAETLLRATKDGKLTAYAYVACRLVSRFWIPESIWFAYPRHNFISAH